VRISVAATIGHDPGPADGVGFEAANPIALRYESLLTLPCFFDPGSEPVDHRPPPTYSGPFAFGMMPSWFRPETSTFGVWAMREAGTCKAEWAPNRTEHVEANGKPCRFHQEPCSPVRTLTLPSVIDVACPIPVAHAKRLTNHHHRRHRR
jgi:hypothetical protein